jgi:predicted lipoprotein with Yx(FWY)xxD motif
MRRLVSVLAVLLLGVGLAACGDDDDDASPTVESDSSTTTAAAEDDEGDEETTTTVAADDEPQEAEIQLSSAETAIGEVITDAEGFTLYLFTVSEDEGACADQCAQTWPPVQFLNDSTTSGNADAALMGVAPLGDFQQVTYNGHRLYRFSGDAAPGETNGHGVGDVWFALDMAGEALPA